MTGCNQASLSFFVKKNLTVDFKGGEISSNAGLLLLRQLDEKMQASKKPFFFFRIRPHTQGFWSMQSGSDWLARHFQAMATTVITSSMTRHPRISKIDRSRRSVGIITVLFAT